MKRREFLKSACIGLAASGIAAPAIAQSNPEIRWRMTSSWLRLTSTPGWAKGATCAWGEDGAAVKPPAPSPSMIETPPVE